MPWKWMQHYVMLARDNHGATPTMQALWTLTAQIHRPRQNIGPSKTSAPPKHRPHQNIDCAKTSTLPKYWLCLNIVHNKNWPQQYNHTKTLTEQDETTPKHRLCQNIDCSKTSTTLKHWPCQNINHTIRIPCKWMQQWWLLQNRLHKKHRPHQNIGPTKTLSVLKHQLCQNSDCAETSITPSIDHSNTITLKHWPCRLKLRQNIVYV